MVPFLLKEEQSVSIVAITNSTPAVVQQYAYDAFGMVTPSQPDFANPYTYTGREWDQELGLYFYRARYYDAMEGRFISKDPIGFAGGDVNLYRYVQNNPIMLIDPSGNSGIFTLLNKVFRSRALKGEFVTVSIESIIDAIGATTIIEEILFQPNLSDIEYMYVYYYTECEKKVFRQANEELNFYGNISESTISQIKAIVELKDRKLVAIQITVGGN